MKKTKLDTTIFGLVLGIWGPVIGFFILFLIFNISENLSWDTYLYKFQNYSSDKSKIISLSLIFNLLLFYFLLKKEWNFAAKGVIFGTLVFAPVIVYFRYFS